MIEQTLNTVNIADNILALKQQVSWAPGSEY